MPQIEMRPVEGEERLEIARRLAAYAFDNTPPLPDPEKWRKELEELDQGVVYYGLFEDGQAVASAAYTPMKLHLRGQFYPAAGVWTVATHPEARRNGYARQLLTRLLEVMDENEQAFTTLYPFKESFYQRLGYTNYPRPRKALFSPQPLVPLLKKELGGSVKLYQMSEGYELYRAFLEKIQPQVEGMGLFDAKIGRAQSQSNSYWYAVAQVEGETVGVMMYRIEGESEDDRRILGRRFYYSTSQGKYLLLDWLARHADQIKQVEIKLRPTDWIETWWPDINPDIRSFEPPMGRVLNLTRVGGLAVGPGQFTTTVQDQYCPWNSGDWRFESVEGRLKISRAESGRSELSLGIEALGGLFFGTHDPADFATRGWGEPTPTQQTALRQMFPPLLPYLHEVF